MKVIVVSSIENNDKYDMKFSPLDELSYSVNVELNLEQEEAFSRARRLRIPFEEVDVLNEILFEVKIEALDYFEQTIASKGFIDRCFGHYPVDGDYINDLVEERDEYTLDFFGLTGQSEEYLSKWDANRVKLPEVCEFYRDFTPYNPTISYSDVYTEFDERIDDELTELEASIVIEDLLKVANGNYSELQEYIERVEWYCDWDEEKSISQLAIMIAEEMHRLNLIKDIPAKVAEALGVAIVR